MEPKIDIVSNVDWRLNRPLRGGVVVYNPKCRMLAFGLDADHEEITDFGGGIRRRESPVDGSVRELIEESLNSFGCPPIVNINRSLVVYSKEMMIIFPKETTDPAIINERFATNLTIAQEKGERIEVSDIIWIPVDEFSNVICQGEYNNIRMYDRVRNFLFRATSNNSKLLDYLNC